MRKALYIEVANEIKNKISQGIFKPGQKLDSEPILAQSLGVSRGTLREALTSLEKEGIITRRHGIGSFINTNFSRIVDCLETLESLTNSIKASGCQAEDRIVSITEDILEVEISDALKVKKDTLGYTICSIKLANKEPIIYCKDIIPSQLFKSKDIIKKREQCDSLTDFFDRFTEYRPTEFISSVNAILPPQDVANVLNIGVSLPLILIKGVLYSEFNVPLSYSYLFFRSDKYEFKLIKKRKPK